jgi:hypothetical protein
MNQGFIEDSQHYHQQEKEQQQNKNGTLFSANKHFSHLQYYLV